MSQENVEIVRRVYSAWARNELPGPARLFDAQIEYVNPPDAVEPGTRRGLGAFTQAVRDAFDGWEAWEIEPERFIPVGERVAVVLRYQAHWRTSGLMWRRMSLRCGRCVIARWSGTSGSTARTTPSKPWDCRSRPAAASGGPP